VRRRQFRRSTTRNFKLIRYAAALGAGLRVLHVVQGAGLAEHFGTRHLGSLSGVTISGRELRHRVARVAAHARRGAALMSGANPANVGRERRSIVMVKSFRH
jgi:hypothetical protein